MYTKSSEIELNRKWKEVLMADFETAMHELEALGKERTKEIYISNRCTRAVIWSGDWCTEATSKGNQERSIFS